MRGSRGGLWGTRGVWGGIWGLRGGLGENLRGFCGGIGGDLGDRGGGSRGSALGVAAAEGGGGEWGGRGWAGVCSVCARGCRESDVLQGCAPCVGVLRALCTYVEAPRVCVDGHGCATDGAHTECAVCTGLRGLRAAWLRHAWTRVCCVCAVCVPCTACAVCNRCGCALHGWAAYVHVCAMRVLCMCYVCAVCVLCVCCMNGPLKGGGTPSVGGSLWGGIWGTHTVHGGPTTVGTIGGPYGGPYEGI